MGNFIIVNFCSPAKVYLIMTFLTLIYYVLIEQGMVWIILKAILFISWSFLLNKLCSSGAKTIPWLLAIIPHFIFLILTIKPSSAPPTKPSPVNSFSLKKLM
jgi:hypothetical protein